MSVGIALEHGNRDRSETKRSSIGETYETENEESTDKSSCRKGKGGWAKERQLRFRMKKKKDMGSNDDGGGYTICGRYCIKRRKLWWQGRLEDV